jgi:hypothetical protein
MAVWTCSSCSHHIESFWGGSADCRFSPGAPRPPSCPLRRKALSTAGDHWQTRTLPDGTGSDPGPARGHEGSRCTALRRSGILDFTGETADFRSVCPGRRVEPSAGKGSLDCRRPLANSWLPMANARRHCRPISSLNAASTLPTTQHSTAPASHCGGEVSNDCRLSPGAPRPPSCSLREKALSTAGDH